MERAIAGGLYAFAFEEEFNRLDKFLEEKTEQFPIVGITEEMVKYVEADGYTTPYYFLAPFGDVYDNIVEKNLENPAISKEEVRTFLENNRQELHKVNVAIQLYMKEEYTAPDKEILEQIASDIENMSDIPYGSYSIHLNDNYIDKKRGTGLKDNTIRRSNQNKIIKR
ncbi:DUF1672 family protein [Paracerasibacillus soli]|uniref:DUF1672 family protein n=1 Tax=Paracerasibacillus soli TaxID=480284 RepID=A0ABU5CU81_9BACI|nr:DUF1672 family protein [Virgibacillus soli]MDY0409407.1 DUF1672 family protein [Virgibacillus soli]